MTIKGIEILDLFLASWKARATEYYTNLYNEFINQRSKRYEITAESLRGLTMALSNKPRYSDEKISEILSDIENGVLANYVISNFQIAIAHDKFNDWKSKFSKIEMSICDRMCEEGYLDKILTRDVEDKKKAFIARVEKKAGKIIDLSNLYIATNGEINGLAEGEIKSVNVQTIYAGGHNIQCLHFRVLVK